MYECLRKPEEVRFPGAGGTDSYELGDMGAGTVLGSSQRAVRTLTC